MRISLVAVGVLAASLAVAAPASATSATSLLHTRIAAEPQVSTPTSIVRLPSMTFRAGSHMYLHAKYTATSSSATKTLQGGQIWCLAPGSTVKSQFTTVNRYSTSRTGAIEVRWVFNVPITASWSCQLTGWAASTGSVPGDYLTVASGAGNTYLYVNDTPKDGLGWTETMPATTIPPSRSLYVNRQTWPASPPATAPSKAISVMAEVEVSDDYTSGSQSATVTATLEVNQISGATVCHSNTPVVSGPATITSLMHHSKFYLNAVNVPVQPGCPNQWAIKVLVQNAGPTPVIAELNETPAPGGSGALAVWGATV